MADREFTDAIALLKADHRKVEGLFEAFQKTEDSRRKEAIANEICNELKIHTAIEEEIFYPAFEGKIDEEFMREAYVEHDGAKVLINDIAASGESDDYYDAKVTVLCEEIDHHVKEEEKPGEGLFAQCRATDVDLVELRDRMLARKQELMAQAESGGLPRAEPAVLAI